MIITDEPSSTLYDPAPKDTVSWAATVLACTGISGTQALLPTSFTERTWASYGVFDARSVMAAFRRCPSTMVVTPRSWVQSDSGVRSLCRTS